MKMKRTNKYYDCYRYEDFLHLKTFFLHPVYLIVSFLVAG